MCELLYLGQTQFISNTQITVFPKKFDSTPLENRKRRPGRVLPCKVSIVPNLDHLQKIQEAVSATHKATILATELLNLHLRKCLAEDPSQDFSYLFNGSWLLNAYNEVTHGKRKVKVESSLRDTRDKCMPAFQAPDRTGIQQCLLYDARNLATVAATNVWLHFQPRMLSHIIRKFDVSEAEYKALSKDEKRQRKLQYGVWRFWTQ